MLDKELPRQKKIAWKSIILILMISLLFTACQQTNDSITSKSELSAFSLCQGELNSNRYTSYEDKTEYEMGLAIDGFVPIRSNNNFTLFYRDVIGGIRLLDRSNNYVWGSLSSDSPDNLNKKWAAYANSIVAIEYSNKDGTLYSLGASGNELTYNENNGKIIFSADWKNIGISFDFELKLTDDGITIILDDSSIAEKKDCLLTVVSFLPYFGATVGDEKNGYMFVPDGCGALIRFESPRNYLQGFSKRIYGPDYGIESVSEINDLGAERINAFATEEKTVSVPVFGMSHGTEQNSYLAVIEKGDEYASIEADPAGIITDYNRIRASFIYRSQYKQPVNKKGSGVQAIQKDRNTVNPRISYYFLSGESSDYVGMACKYRSLLEKTNVLRNYQNTRKQIPIRLDFLMSDVQKEFIGTSVNKITNIGQIEHLINRLNKIGIFNLSTSLLGYQKKGLNGYKLTDVRQKSLFNDNEINHLKSKLINTGGSLSIAQQFFMGTDKQLSVKFQAAITLSQEICKINADDENAFLSDIYYVKPRMAIDTVCKYLENIKMPVVLSDLGSELYGEYLESKVTTRGQTLDLLIEKLKQFDNLTLVTPNSYLYNVTSSYYDMPMVSSQLLFETDTVPFLQIVLSGSMDIYSPYINCSFYSKNDILKAIDYNTYPSFVLTGKRNYELRNTASADLQSSYIGDWTDYIIKAYKTIDDILSHTSGKTIIDRKVLKTGVVRVDYTDGSVYVNYTDSDYYTAENILISPQSAKYIA